MCKYMPCNDGDDDDLLFPRNAYNMAKIRGTVRGTEGGTVRGGDQKSWCLTAQKLGHLVLGIAQ